MGTKPANNPTAKTPPPLLEAIVTSLTPKYKRDEFLPEMRERYEAKPDNVRYAREAAVYLSSMIPGTALLALAVPLVAAEACTLCISFAGAPVSIGLFCGLIAGLVVLRLRDGHTYPTETVMEAFLDALMAVTFTAATLILMAGIQATPHLSTPVMLRGLLSSLVTLTLLRAILRKPPTTAPTPRQQADRSYNMAFRLNVIWGAAWFIMLTSISGDAPNSILGTIFILAPIAIITASYRSRQEGIRFPHKSEMHLSALGNNDKMDLMRKKLVLWIPRGIAEEVVFFAVIVANFAYAFFTPSITDKFRVGTNFTAFLMLFIVWRYLRKANRSSGRLVQEEIDKITAAELVKA